jgi:DNA polymerase-1
MAMTAVFSRLEREKLQARLVLQVHDELIVECPREESERVKALLTEEMEGVFALNPALVADAHSGSTWAEAKG